MARPDVELASIRSLVEELQVRVSGIAVACQSAAQEDVSRVLFEAERALRSAGKQVARAERMLG